MVELQTLYVVLTLVSPLQHKWTGRVRTLSKGAGRVCTLTQNSGMLTCPGQCPFLLLQSFLSVEELTFSLIIFSSELGGT